MRKLFFSLILLLMVGSLCSSSSAKVSISPIKNGGNYQPAIELYTLGQSGLEEMRPCVLTIFPRRLVENGTSSLVDSFLYNLSFCIYDKNQTQVISLPKIRNLAFEFVNKKTNVASGSLSVSFTQTQDIAFFSIEADDSTIKTIVENLMDDQIITVISFDYSTTFFAATFSIDEKNSFELVLQMINSFYSNQVGL